MYISSHRFNRIRSFGTKRMANFMRGRAKAKRIAFFNFQKKSQ